MAQYDGSIRINTQINTQGANAQLMSLQNRIVKTADKIVALRAKMDALKNAQVPTQEYKEISAQIEKAEQKFNKLLEKQEQMQREGKDNGVAWERINAQMDEVGNEIRYAKDELKDLVETGKAFTLGSDTEEYANLGRQLRYAENDLAVLVQRHSELEERQRNSSSGYKKLGQVAKNAFSKIGTFVKKNASSAFDVLKKKLKEAISHISLFGKSTKSTNNMLNSGFKAILKYGLGIRSFYILVNKFRTAVKKGFENLAQYSGETNAAISSLMSALTQLKNSLATAFNPILTAAAPALTSFINMVSKAVTYVGMLIAALTGQKTFTKAVAVQENYAESLKNTSKESKDAKKETDKYLSSLDEVARFDDGKDSDSDSDSGYKAPTPGEMFETVPIESSIKNLADKIRELIKSEDWEGLGEYLAEGINSGLQKVYDAINWDTVGPRITYFVNAFTSTLNSLVDHLDWDLLGRTIGTGINTLVNTFNLLIGEGGIDFELIGTKLSVGLRGMMNEIEWTNLGNLLGNKFMIQWNIFTGFVDDMWRKDDLTGLSGWSELGKSLAEGLNGIFEKIDLKKIGKTLGRALTGVFQSAIDFAKTFDWNGLGKNITSGISAFFSNIDWGTVAGGISSFAVGILEFLTGLIQGVDWGSIPQGIIDAISTFFSGLDYDAIFGAVGELIGVAIAAGIDLLAALGDVLANAWDGVVKYFSGYIEESGGDIVLGIWNGIINALKNIGKWIYDHIFKPFIDGFKNAFGIHSPSTVMQEQGNFIMDGLLNGIAERINSVVEKFGEIRDKIVEKWEEVKTNTQEKWSEIKENLSEKWGNLKEDASEKFENIRKTIFEKWKDVKSNTSEKWGEIKEKVSDTWKNIKSNAKESASNIKQKVIETWEGLKTRTREIWDGIKNVIKSPINAVIGFLNKMIEGIVDGINTLIDALNSLSVSNPFTGDTIVGFDIPTLTAPKIPALATGAVIPPNREFLAVLGEQKHGTNIEAPLSTIEEAVINAMAKFMPAMQQQGGNAIYYNFSAQINRRVLFEEMIEEARLRQTISGRNPFEMA